MGQKPSPPGHASGEEKGKLVGPAKEKGKLVGPVSWENSVLTHDQIEKEKPF
jgi:hypothetical protein